MTAPLILVDGSSYFFRAFHALPPLMNSKGQPTGAVYGVANMIKKLLNDYNSDKVAVVFDAKGKTFRDELYPQYKAHRAPMPADLHSQFEPLLALLTAMGLPLLTIPGVEADDVIGTLAEQARARKIPVIISTGDKDMAQLVCEHVHLINTMSGKTLDIQGVINKFGVRPEQFIDYLSLIGDSVDNIPGVNKCGPKTAAKWLADYQTLDNLMAQAAQISGKIGENLRASLVHLPLSRQLVTIKKDVVLPLTIDDLVLQKTERETLIDLVRELEFKTWLKELLADKNSGETTARTKAESTLLDFEIITQKKDFDKFRDKLSKTDSLSFQVLSKQNVLSPASLFGIAFAGYGGRPVFIPLQAQCLESELTVTSILESLAIFFADPALKKIGHDVKASINVLRDYGIRMDGVFFDTMLAAYVLNSSAGGTDFPSLALKYLGHSPVTLAPATKTGKTVDYNNFDLEQLALYAAEQAQLQCELSAKLRALFPESLLPVFTEIEMPLLLVLAEMEACGVLIDQQALQRHGNRLKERIKTLEQEALLLAGCSFNLNSPKQLQEILFDKLNLPITTKTPTGQPSTAEGVLQELAYDYRLPAVILEYRSLSKLVSTYIDALPKCINPLTGRVHTSYNQAVAATGRLSSSEPNLQNIPVRSEEGRLIRTTFIAPNEYVILAADYSQIELRIMAHLSQDKNLLYAFAHDLDIHTATASEIFQIPIEEVNAEQRRRIKAVNFGLIYGMSAFGLAKQLGIDRQDAQYYMDCYFKRYPGVLEYMEQSRINARKHGYVETLFGRRLYIPEINAQNLMRQRAAERIAINAPMQGTAADIIKKAMLAIANWQRHQPQHRVNMIMQVHDELVFEVHQDELVEITAVLKTLMEGAAQLSVPLKVSIGTGANWGEAH